MQDLECDQCKNERRYARLLWTASEQQFMSESLNFHPAIAQRYNSETKKKVLYTSTPPWKKVI